MVVLAALTGLSAVNIGVRLGSSAQAWWIWPIAGAVVVGSGVAIWAFTLPEEPDQVFGGILAVTLAGIVLLTFGVTGGRQGHPVGRSPVLVADWVQATASAAVIGVTLGAMAMIARGRSLPSAGDPHRVSVDIYPSPMTEQRGRFTIILPPPETDGYYQARCRCGWRGVQRSMDVDAAEAIATSDGEKHRRAVRGLRVDGDARTASE